MALFSLKTLRNICLLWLLCLAMQRYLNWKSYSIVAKDFKVMTTKLAVGSGETSIPTTVAKLEKSLRRDYGDKLSDKIEWLPLSAGGLNLRVLFLYADWTEYIAVFASATKTVGNSGMHWVNSTCTVLSGNVSRVPHVSDTATSSLIKQGEIFRHGQFDRSTYELSENAVVACYGRGFMPASSLWIVSGSLANGDPWPAMKLLYAYSKMAVTNMALPVVAHYRQVEDWFKNMAKEKWTKAEL
uniref:Sigma non-opioid intracellular receptor 1 n=1 Tax=Ditylenchus dipsaci TaxID=166011 RepID=A0A915CRB7_9BILA